VVVSAAQGRVPVLAGTGSNSTAEAIELTRKAEAAGADGALLISPYYNKPPQEGIFQHFANVAAATSLPIVVYNIPGRTGSNIAPETLGRLSQIETIVGVKEASGSMDQILAVIAATGPDFSVFSGDDGMTLPIMGAGGRGVISVTSNIVPERFTGFAHAIVDGRMDEARAEAIALLPLIQALMTLEVNPIPIKTAMAMTGACRESFRLPLVRMGAAQRERLRQALGEFSLV